MAAMNIVFLESNFLRMSATPVMTVPARMTIRPMMQRAAEAVIHATHTHARTIHASAFTSPWAQADW